MVYKQFTSVFYFGWMINWISIKLKSYHKRRQKVRACIRRRTSWYRAPFGWEKLVVVPSMDLQRKCTPASGSCKNNTKLNIWIILHISYRLNYSLKLLRVRSLLESKKWCSKYFCSMKSKSYSYNKQTINGCFQKFLHAISYCNVNWFIINALTRK